MPRVSLVPAIALSRQAQTAVTLFLPLKGAVKSGVPGSFAKGNGVRMSLKRNGVTRGAHWTQNLKEMRNDGDCGAGRGGQLHF